MDYQCTQAEEIERNRVHDGRETMQMLREEHVKFKKRNEFRGRRDGKEDGNESPLGKEAAELECDMPVNDESSPIFTTFSNPLFDSNDDFTSSDDESLSNEDVPMEIFKIYSNPLFEDEEIISTKIDPHSFNVESNLIESLLNHDTLIDSSPKFDYLHEEFSDPIPPGIKKADFDLEEEIRLAENLSDSHMEEIDLFLAPDDLMPPGIEDYDYDSKGDIHFLEELLSNNSSPLPESESSHFNLYDDPSYPRPPSKPPDVEIL
ncbi:hypothetical protein Tco_0495647 [Tanacetum coccineum]